MSAGIWRRVLRRAAAHLTYANVVASLAIFVAMGGTSYAAVKLSGKNIQNGSITGVKIKNGTLSATNLQAAALQLLHGAKGDQGLQGFKGDTGPTGPTGLTGPAGQNGADGAPANVASSFASHDSGLLTESAANPPDPSGLDWDAPTYNGGNEAATDAGDYPLTSGFTQVVALAGLTGDSRYPLDVSTTNGQITAPWSSNLSATATVSMLHMQVQGVTLHSRIQCRLRYANSETPSTFSDLGVYGWASSDAKDEIVPMSLAGSVNVGPGTYNVRVECQDADYTGHDQWKFVKGNITVLAAQNGN